MSMSPAMLALIKGAKNKFSRSTNKVIKLKEGKTTIRILQPIANDKFWEEYGVHWIKPDLNEKPIAVVGCSMIVHSQPCDVCTAIEKAIKAATSDEDIKLYKSWMAKPQILLNVLFRSGSEASEEPQILEITPTTFGSILGMIEEYEADYGNVLDPKDGIDFTIERSGRGLDTKYSVLPKFKAAPVPKGTLEKCHDLKAYVEKEHFKGEEEKAINAIANLTGISTVGLISAPRTNTALLTGKTATVEDAEVEAAIEAIETVDEQPEVEIPPKAVPKAVAPAAKPAAKVAVVKVETEVSETIPQSEIDDILGELDNL